MERKQLIRDIAENLRRLKTKRSFSGYRFAGALETLLALEGFFHQGEEFQYKTGGKKYIPFIADFRWTESYPDFIMRRTEDYLAELVNAEKNNDLIKQAWANGWVLTGNKSEECYWWNSAKNEKKWIDWGRPLADQMPFEIKKT
jgi:hypothetical protein